MTWQFLTSFDFPASEGILSTDPLRGSAVGVVKYTKWNTLGKIDTPEWANRYHWPIKRP